MPSLTRPISVQLEITDKCNARCRHCYHLDFNQASNSNDLPDKQVMALSEKLVLSGIFSVVITGGEPLIRKNLVKEIVKYLKGNNVSVSLNTNLLLIDSAILDSFLIYALDGMLVSCPSANSSVYTFMTGGGNYSKFEANLKMLINSGQRFAVNMVVNRHNLGNIKETAMQMRKLGVKIFGATPMGLNSQSLQDITGTQQWLMNICLDLFVG